MTCTACISCPFEDANIPNNIHEIHVTVRNADVERFKTICTDNHMKPVLIALQDEIGGVSHQLMTSHTVTGKTQAEVINKATTDTGILLLRGFDVVRTKIETTLTSPFCLDRQPGTYYEAHIEIILYHEMMTNNLNWYEQTWNAVKRISPRLHLSANAFKKNSEFNSYFVTYRDFNEKLDSHSFNSMVQDLKRELEMYFHTGKVRCEYVWLDTNISVDKDWK